MNRRGALSLNAARDLARHHLSRSGDLSWSSGCVVRRHSRSGRSRIYTVQAGVDRLVVKQQSAALRNDRGGEAWLYGTVAKRGAGAALAKYLPPCIFSDSAAQIVGIGYIADTPSLFELSQDDPGRALHELSKVGPALRALHAVPIDTSYPFHAATLPRIDPALLEEVAQWSAGTKGVVQIVQSRPLLSRAYSAARSDLRREVLVHGDIKSDNVLASAPAITLLDWEFVGAGPRALDVGAVLGSALALWIDSLALDPDRSVADWVRDAGIPFSEVKGTWHRFLEHYGHSVRSSDLNHATVFDHAAAWLVGRACADASLAYDVPAQARLRLLVAENVATQGLAA